MASDPVDLPSPKCPALRRIIEGVKRNHLPSVMVFIDFSKAFDSINHTIMFRIQSAYDIPKRLLEAIML